MTGPQTYERLGEHVLEQHRQVHFFLDRLQRSVEALDPDRADTERLARLSAEIASFHHHLAEHNRAEIEGGLLQSVLDLLPEAEDSILRLTEQHDRMLEAIASLRSRAQHVGPSDVAALRDELSHALDAIREHESTEEALLERALLRDRRSS